MAYEFDGSSGEILATIAAVDSGDLTICAWVNGDGSGEGAIGNILSLFTAGAVLRQVLRCSGTTYEGIQVFGTTNATSRSPASSRVDGSWIFIALTFEDADNKIRLLNGDMTTAVVEYGSYSVQTAGAGTRSTGGTKARIGNNAAGTATFDGEIARTAIFTRRLTDAEIEELRNGTTSAEAMSGVLAYWPLASDANDIGPNNYHGTVSGATLVADPTWPTMLVTKSVSDTLSLALDHGIDPFSVGDSAVGGGDLIRAPGGVIGEEFDIEIESQDLSGTASISSTASVAVAAGKSASNVAAISSNVTLTVSGAKGALNTASINSTVSVTATGTKGAASTAPITSVSTTTATGQKAGFGIGIVPSVTSTAGTETTARFGVTAALALSSVTETGARGTSAGIVINTTTVTTATGVKGGRNIAGVNHTSAAITTGRKGTQNVASSITSTVSLVVAAKKNAFGIGTVSPVASSVTSQGIAQRRNVVSIPTTTNTTSTGRKGAVNVALVTSSSSATGTETTARFGAASVSSLTTETATAAHGTSADIVISSTATTIVSGTKSTSNNGVVGHTPTATVTGGKQSSGIALVSQISVTVVAGKKNAFGTGSISVDAPTSAEGTSFEFRGGPGSISITTSTSTTGQKVASGVGVVSVPVLITSAQTTARSGAAVLTKTVFSRTATGATTLRLPYDAVQEITTDAYTIIWGGALNDWVAAGHQSLISHQSGTGSWYIFRTLSTGVLNLITYEAPDAADNHNATKALPGGFTDGSLDSQEAWFKARFDRTHSPTQMAAEFWYSLDQGETWISLGSPVSNSNTDFPAVNTGGTLFTTLLGRSNTGTQDPALGWVSYAEIIDGNGVSLFRIRTDSVVPTGTQTPASLVDETGQTWSTTGTGWEWDTVSSSILGAVAGTAVRGTSADIVITSTATLVVAGTKSITSTGSIGHTTILTSTGRKGGFSISYIDHTSVTVSIGQKSANSIVSISSISGIAVTGVAIRSGAGAIFSTISIIYTGTRDARVVGLIPVLTSITGTETTARFGNVAAGSIATETGTAARGTSADVAINTTISIASAGTKTTNGTGRITRSTIESSTAAWRATDYDEQNDCLIDLSGNGHHARLGSTAGADTNDPLRLLYAGEKYVYFPGVTTDFISAAGAGPSPATTEFDYRIRVTPTDWTPPTRYSLITKHSAAGNRAIWWELFTDGKFTLRLYEDGSTPVLATSSEPVGAANGTALWLRVTWRASDGRVQFFTHPDQTTPPDAAAYTQLGTDQTIAIASIFNATASLRIGQAQSGSLPLDGNVYRVDLRNAIDGAVVASFDASTLTEPYASVVDSQDITWNLSRSTSGRKLTVVDRTLLLFGTDDYCEVADHADLDFEVADSFTVAALAGRHGLANTTTDSIIAKKTGSGSSAPGYVLCFSNVSGAARIRSIVSDGTVSVTSDLTGYMAGFAQLHAMVRDAGQDRVFSHAGGTTNTGAADNTTVTLDNSAAMRIGRFSGGGTNYADMVFFGAAVCPEALSASELELLKLELLGEIPVIVAGLKESSNIVEISSTTSVTGSGRKNAFNIGAISLTHNTEVTGIAIEHHEGIASLDVSTLASAAGNKQSPGTALIFVASDTMAFGTSLTSTGTAIVVQQTSVLVFGLAMKANRSSSVSILLRDGEVRVIGTKQRLNEVDYKIRTGNVEVLL
ncbi:MAG TPA: LamG-like jellyroll fold domain-containing protein [Nitrososphaera sp.]|nr:LamG-like jellyroll fold domain-containing protein [Nitrososphaera sp.]